MLYKRRDNALGDLQFSLLTRWWFTMLPSLRLALAGGGAGYANKLPTALVLQHLPKLWFPLLERRLAP